MKPYIIVSRKTLFSAIAVLVFLIFLLDYSISLQSSRIDGSSHQKREQFLNSVNLFIDQKNISSKEITLPASFNKIYSAYNSLQKKSGFDLTKYKGENATLYNYITNDGSKVELIVHKGRIIGGHIDVFGKQKPLK